MGKHLPGTSMIQAIGLSHDLGHPPFGHGGEIALNYCMRKHGGFEGNGQTLRILSKLEKFSESCGTNLSRRTLLHILKYPVPFSVAFNPALSPRLDEKTTAISIIDRECSKPPKCYMDSEQSVVDWVLKPLEDKERIQFCSLNTQTNKHHKPLHKSFDCSIMDVADDIAFGVHDLEDLLALRLIEKDDFRDFITEVKCSTFLESIKEYYPGETIEVHL